MLVHAGQRVEDGALSDIGISGKRDDGRILIRAQDRQHLFACVGSGR